MTLPPSILSIKETAPRRPSRTFVPKLRWPSLDAGQSAFDLDRFPAWDEEHRRYSAGEFGSWSHEFMEAVRGVRDRVWLIDGFLLKVDEYAKANFVEVFDRVLRKTLAQDIRLIIAPKAGHQEQIEQLHRLQDERRAPPRNQAFTIEIQLVRGGRGSARLPHDRFAIIDDELWHWGANVGGTHHEVNAYSRAWPVQDTLAAEYFQRLWKAAKEGS